MVIFQGGPGRVVAMNDPGVPAAIQPLVKPDPTILFADQKSIITRVMIAKASSFQFLHTLGGDLYIYVFGERIGNLSLSGLSFAQDCTNGDDDGEHGIEKIIDYYDENKLSANSDPMSILLGKRTVLKAFLANFSADVVDPQSFLMQWTLDLMLVPEK